MVDLTVAIPTHNGEKRLPDVLDRLRSQIDTESFAWEVLVVDNNSTDRTAHLVREYQKTWPAAYPLKYCFAPQQGAAFARQRAIEKACGELIGFLDDDNLPENNWVAAAYNFGQKHPEVGAYGSQIHADFFEQEQPDDLPDNFNQITCFLAIVERGKTPHLYDPKNKILPPGAGLVVRKTAWLDRVPPRLVLNHQGKQAGMASEDLEALLHIQKAGWEIWYNPDMVVYHKIPNSRLKIGYLRLLTRCVGLSRHRLRMMTLESWQRPLAFPAYLANDLRRLVLHLIKHGLDVKEDPVAACQREFLSSSLVSPFFLLKKQYRDLKETRRTEQYLSNSSMILEEIAEGFEKDRFQLFSQEIKPIAQSNSSPNYSEILLRLQNDRGQIMPPRDFMPIAQYYKLMRTIDRWVIRTLFRQIAAYPQIYQDPCLYEINLSIDSIYDRQFIEFLKHEFAHWQIPPEFICFSIPENLAIAHLDRLIQFISGIKHIGSHFVLDHVGVQNPASDYLKQLPVDYLKIDGHFVRNLSHNQQSLDKIESLNQLGHKLGMKTIAEAVETPEILQAIKSIGVNYVQGFGIAPTHPLIVSQSQTLNRAAS